MHVGSWKKLLLFETLLLEVSQGKRHCLPPHSAVRNCLTEKILADLKFRSSAQAVM